MYEELGLLINHQTELEKRLRIFVINYEISLDERWTCFTIGIEAGMGEDVVNCDGTPVLQEMAVDSFDWCDTYHLERYEERSAEQIVAELELALSLQELPEGYQNFNELEVTREGVDKFKEECLTNFTRGFTNDW